MPLLSWSTFGNLRLTSNSQRNRSTGNSDKTRESQRTRGSRSTQGTQTSRDPTETEGTILSTYQGRSFDPTLLASSFRHLSLDTVSSITPKPQIEAQSKF